MGFLGNEAFWAAVAALLAALGVEIPSQPGDTILEALAMLAALVSIVQSLMRAGHRFQYVKPQQPPGP